MPARTSTDRNHILLVEDDDTIGRALGRFLDRSGFRTSTARTLDEARRVIVHERFHLAVVDHRLPDGSSLDFLSHLREEDIDLPVVVLTGYATISLAVQAMQEGAESFLAKPIDLDTLGVVVRRTLDRRLEARRSVALRRSGSRQRLDPFLGSSPAIQALRAESLRIVSTDRPILLLGETGVGKGVLARWMHEASPRRQEPFVDVNCATLSSELLESELFGHARGAFTGAVQSKRGLFEVADGGTLFLDEIGDLPLQLQPRILKAIEDQAFRRVGETKDRKVDVRIIAATHQDLPRLAREGRFRSDLYFRVAALPLGIPPLRERLPDLPHLSRSMLDQIGLEMARPDLELEAEALDALHGYGWPGNLRELKNVLERAAILSPGSPLGPDHLRFESGHFEPHEDEPTTLAELERRHIRKTLDQCEGHVPTAAARLDIPRSTLYKKIERLGLRRK